MIEVNYSTYTQNKLSKLRDVKGGGGGGDSGKLG